MLDPQLREGNMAAVGVHSGVNKLQFWEMLLYCLLNLFPVNFEIFASLNLSLVSDDDWVVEVFLDQNYFAVLIVLILLGLCGFFLRLEVSLLDVGVVWKLFLGKGFVISASHSITLDFKLRRLCTGVFDVFDSAADFFYVVTVEEVGDGDEAVLRGLDLLAEEFVLS